MFEQLHGRLAAATYTATAPSAQVAGLVQRVNDQITALNGGVAIAADSTTATTVAGAIGIARAAVAAQSFPSLSAKQQALGQLDSLAATLAGELPGS